MTPTNIRLDDATLAQIKEVRPPGYSQHATLRALVQLGLATALSDPSKLSKALEGQPYRGPISVIPPDPNQVTTGDYSVVTTHGYTVATDPDPSEAPAPVMLPFIQHLKPIPDLEESVTTGGYSVVTSSDYAVVTQDESEPEVRPGRLDGFRAGLQVQDLYPSRLDVLSEPEGELDEEGDLIIEEPVSAMGHPKDAVEDLLDQFDDFEPT